MLAMKDTIMIILVDKRSAAAQAVQELLTKYGAMIKIRLGLHELDGSDECGQILLQLRADEDRLNQLSAELSKLRLVRVKTMDLN